MYMYMKIDTYQVDELLDNYTVHEVSSLVTIILSIYLPSTCLQAF